ncbi:hypothetical protein [Fulvivirga sedimenti]|uniref:Glycine zipper family protein n=1 Tax=Fulvivirga sedimenti TaxID=2879465 RepID=A0A9X1HLR7_9BACT|nr:hypothetical protein [Fulvivirga sedimenti]MCA6074340.1 hypothetical protein [Fulvivirga sedimenti]
MEYTRLQPMAGPDPEKGLSKRIGAFQKLLEELEKRQLPVALISSVNDETQNVNKFVSDQKKYSKQLRKSQSAILQIVEKEQNLVVKKHYQMRWLALGMAVFGVPLGVSFGLSMGNMAFLGVGLPIGMVIGMAVGANLDKKAAEEGRQLDVEIL